MPSLHSAFKVRSTRPSAVCVSRSCADRRREHIAGELSRPARLLAPWTACRWRSPRARPSGSRVTHARRKGQDRVPNRRDPADKNGDNPRALSLPSHYVVGTLTTISGTIPNSTGLKTSYQFGLLTADLANPVFLFRLVSAGTSRHLPTASFSSHYRLVCEPGDNPSGRGRGLRARYLIEAPLASCLLPACA